jgi:hypothetical protein
LAEPVRVRQQGQDIVRALDPDEGSEASRRRPVVSAKACPHRDEGAEVLVREISFGVVASDDQGGIVLAAVVDLFFDERLALDGTGQGPDLVQDPEAEAPDRLPRDGPGNGGDQVQQGLAEDLLGEQPAGQVGVCWAPRCLRMARTPKVGTGVAHDRTTEVAGTRGKATSNE